MLLEFFLSPHTPCYLFICALCVDIGNSISIFLYYIYIRNVYCEREKNPCYVLFVHIFHWFIVSYEIIHIIFAVVVVTS